MTTRSECQKALGVPVHRVKKLGRGRYIATTDAGDVEVDLTSRPETPQAEDVASDEGVAPAPGPDSADPDAAETIAQPADFSN